MAQHSLRYSQLIAFDNAAAGHDGVLSDPSGDMFVKPCKEAEIDFYQSTILHPEFSMYIPTFKGTLKLQNSSSAKAAADHISSLHNADHVDASSLINSHQAWAPSNGGRITTDSAIVLENTTAGFKKPNILDVKLGARLWADDASQAKRARLDQRAEETTSKSLGFRIAGMRTWQADQSSEQDESVVGCYKKYEKEYGQSLTIETISQAFEGFLVVENSGVTPRLARKVVKNFLQELRELQVVLENEESRMYSASLLFVYEGDGKALQEAFEARERLHLAEEGYTTESPKTDDDDDEDEDQDVHFPKTQAVKLIDFAHAAWTPGQGPDENLLHGVRNVIRILDELCG